MTLFEFDKNLNQNLLCGVDEAGRGPLAGPVVAAAVILKDDAYKLIPEVNDSKKLSEKKREALYNKILDSSKSWAVGISDVEEIEKINILQATFLAMSRAVEALDIKPEFVLVDGNKLPKNLSVQSKCLVKGDSKSASVAAASIIAKVTRDRMMIELDDTYPEYGFKKHKGYGTSEHYENIIKYGVTPIHRMSFLKKMREKHPTVQFLGGKIGEKLSYGWLCNHGYDVIAKNYKSEYGEIDLIAIKDKYICFIEVKLRNSNCLYAPKEAVTKSKQKKIIKTAMEFMQKHPNEYQPRFDVVEVKSFDYKNFEINMIDNAFGVMDEHELFRFAL